MLADKVEEMKASAKRSYTKFTMLTSVAVFGAIALAQAQKDDPLAALESLPDSIPAAFAEARPIPLGQEGEAASDHHASGVMQASGELTLPEHPSESEGDSQSWGAPDSPETENLDAPMAETEATERPPSRFQRSFAAEPAAEEAAEEAYPEADGSEGPLADAQDMLPSPRRNPFRGSAPAALMAAGAEVAADAADTLAPESNQGMEAPPLLQEGSAEPQPMGDPASPTPGHPESSTPGDSGSLEPAPGDAPPYSNELDAGAPLPGSASQDHATLQPVPQLGDDPAAAAPHATQTLQPEPSARQAMPDYNEAASPGAAADPATEGPGAAMLDNLNASGQPGPQSLEGPQIPSLTLEKIAPAEIQVGQPAKFQIRLRNTGRVAAANVLIRDELPAGTRFVDASPKASRAADGAIFWEIGTVAPGQDVMVELELMPQEEGTVGSVATVSFQASASARTRATKPGLVLEHSGPAKVLKGDLVRFAIKLTNPGSGAATGVTLEEDVPAGLTHSSGPKLEYEVGTIAPGQTRHLELTLKAADAGRILNSLTARANGGLEVNHSVDLEVVAPQLSVTIEGPSKRYLDRQATFNVAVANPGTADAQEVELVAQLPTGLKFVSTNNSGYYDQARHAIVWSLERLPAGEMGKAQFTAVPVQIGQFNIIADSTADTGLEAHQEHALKVEGIAALMFSVADKVDPIEIGGQTAYEIRVVNQGSKPATNIQFSALVPDGLKPVGAEGPSAETISGQQVSFAPLPELAPKDQATFRIMVEGAAAGDHRFRVQMTSDDVSTPVIKEESTNVYAD